jgi:hypothetical protein
MLRKIATLETLEAYRVPAHADARALRKAAHRVSFEYTPRPGYLYVRSRAISSRCNDNFDEFPAEEIAKAYATFKGKPVFVNHHNDDHRRMRGVIIDAALHQDRNPDGTPDTWAEVLMEVDAKTFPKLAKAILAGEVDRTSMGCDVQLSVCSACGNKATNPAEYCQHIPAMKGQRIFRATASGQREGHLVREICYGLGFFENSLLVEEPADPTAYFLGVDDRGLKASAAKTADVRHNPQYEGTHCLMCGDPVRWNSNPAKQSLPSGGWYHHDSIKRDHHALPADPEAVMNDVPRQDAQRDQIDAQIREQYGFGPKRHKDMPLDPFVSAYAPELDELGPVEAAAGPKYPDPADHPFFKKNPINHQHIVDTYNESDEGTRAQGKRWYPDAHILAKAIDPEGNAARGAGVLSAYSPQTSWPVNAMNAARSLQRGKAMQKGEGQIMASHAKSAQRIIEGEHHSDVFKGPKIRAFAHLIEHGGDDHSVVVDRHALSVAMGKRVSKDDLADAPLSTPHYYGHVERAYQDAAKQLSGQHGETIHPHEVQATTWLQQQKRNAVDNETARGGQGKGLITRDKNDWRDWENYHQKNHPDLPKSLHTTNPHAPKTEAMRKGAPFAGYEDFAACVAANQDKDDPEAYCGSIKHKVEGAQHTAAHRVYVDQAEGSHGRMVTFSGEDKGGYLSRGDGTWMAENDNGSVVHEHRDHKRALRGLADHYGLTGDLDVEYTHEGTGNRKNFTVPGKTAALNDVVAPPEVDTLRDEECPVCGEVEVYDGERCPVCGFVAPPEMFRDPDLEMAKSIDLRQDQQAQAGDPAPGQANPDVPGGGLVDPSQLGDDPLADQLQHPDQLGPNGEMGEPGTPGDGTPDLFCPACGEGFDAGQPMTTDGDPATLDASGPAEGTPCPNCGMSTLLSPNDMEGMGIGPDGEQAVAEEAEEMGDRPMDAGTPEEDPEAPQEGEGPPEQQEEEGPPTEEDDDSDEPAVDEDDQPSKKRDDKNAKGASMSKSVEAALAANTAAVGSLMRELRIVRAQNDLIAKAAGLEGEFSEIRRQADINNPASPVPDPGEQAPSETTEEAVTPEAADDPQRPGMTPGSVGGVPAEQVDTPLRPGVTLPTAPATNLVDVTAPVAGTNTGELSPEQTRIETDVRVGDPMANANSDESKMFPWTIGAQNANRTMASMRLAELRIAANLAPAGDRFALAASIETDANLPDAALATEIRTLEAVSRTAARQPRPTNLVPRAAATEGRTAPSLAPQPVGAPVGGGGYDDTADSDLFF